MPALILLLAMTQLARAVELVVYDDDAAAAVAAVERIAPHASLRALSLSELVGAVGPRVLSGGVAEVCAAHPVHRAEVYDALKEAEGAMRFLESAAATQALDRAAAALGCLDEVVDPVVAARVYYLRGMMSYAAGDPDRARGAFVRAHHFRPDLTWDDDFAPDARGLFDSTLTAPNRTIAVAFLPAPTGDVWVDGHPVPAVDLLVDVGSHLIQAPGTSLATLDLTVTDDSEVRLLLPAGLGPRALETVGTAAHEDALSLVLSAAVGDGLTAWVVAGSGVWRTTTGGGEFTRPAAPSVARSPRPLQVALVGSGSAILAGGATLAVVSYFQGVDAYADSQAPPTWSAYEAASARRDGAAGRLLLGELLGAGGGLLAGVGLAVGPHTIVSPLLRPDAVGISIGTGASR